MKKTLLFFVFLIVNFGGLYLGGILMGSNPGSNTWYNNLQQAPWTPPGLQLYPNPSIDVIKITNSVVENYSILSSNGAIVCSGKVINNEISVSHLDAGIYFLNLTVKGESQTIRIIKN